MEEQSEDRLKIHEIFLLDDLRQSWAHVRDPDDSGQTSEYQATFTLHAS